MKKSILFYLLSTFIFSTQTAAQIKERQYVFPHEGDITEALYTPVTTDSLQFFLNLYSPSSIYEITVTGTHEDMIFVTVYSSGDYKIKGNQILLFDPIHNLELTGTLSEDNDVIVFTKCFAGMKGIEYRRVKPWPSYYNNKAHPMVYDTSGINEKLEHYKRSKPFRDIRNATYRGSAQESLILDKDKSFVLLRGEKLVILKGTYATANNCIILYDDSLKAKFYLGAIHETILEGILIPGLLNNESGNVYSIFSF